MPDRPTSPDGDQIREIRDELLHAVQQLRADFREDLDGAVAQLRDDFHQELDEVRADVGDGLASEYVAGRRDEQTALGMGEPPEPEQAAQPHGSRRRRQWPAYLRPVNVGLIAAPLVAMVRWAREQSAMSLVGSVGASAAAGMMIWLGAPEPGDVAPGPAPSGSAIGPMTPSSSSTAARSPTSPSQLPPVARGSTVRSTPAGQDDTAAGPVPGEGEEAQDDPSGRGPGDDTGTTTGPPDASGSPTSEPPPTTTPPLPSTGHECVLRVRAGKLVEVCVGQRAMTRTRERTRDGDLPAAAVRAVAGAGLAPRVEAAGAAWVHAPAEEGHERGRRGRGAEAPRGGVGRPEARADHAV